MTAYANSLKSAGVSEKLAEKQANIYAQNIVSASEACNKAAFFERMSKKSLPEEAKAAAVIAANAFHELASAYLNGYNAATKKDVAMTAMLAVTATLCP
jgi:hypothetical protein